MRRARWLIVVAAACNNSKPPPAPPEVVNGAQKLVEQSVAAAKPAAGSIEIAKAWVYTPAPQLAAGHRWIAVDVDFGKVDIDPDHIELADADGKDVAALGDISRLDAQGGRIPLMTPEHSSEAHYLLSFDMPERTKRVSLKYWGETLTGKPADIAASGPSFPEPSRAVIRHFADGKRHVLVYEDAYLDHAPSAFTEHIKSQAGECAMLAVLPVDAKLRPIPTPLEPTIAHALYVVDYECKAPPTAREVGRAEPLPAAERLALPAETLAELEGRAPNTRVVTLPDAAVQLALRADGSMIAAALRKDAIRLLAPDGSESGRLGRMDDPIAVAFLPDGKHLVSVDHEDGVALWDLEVHRAVTMRTLDPAPHDVGPKPVLSPDGRMLAIEQLWTKQGSAGVAGSGQITMLSTADLAPVWNAKLVDNHSGALIAIAISPDSAHVVACWRDVVDLTKHTFTFSVLAAATGKAEVSVTSDKIIGTCGFAPDGKVLIGYGDGLATYDAHGKLIRKQAGEAMPTAIASAPDGSIVTAGEDGFITRWGHGAGERISGLHFRTPATEALSWGNFLVGCGVFEAVVLDRDNKVVQRFRGGSYGVEQVLAGKGLLLVKEAMSDAGRSRLRIVRP